MSGIAPDSEFDDGEISGTTVTMEYSTIKGGVYLTCDDVSTIVSPGTYYVRYAADETHMAGVDAIVVVPSFI